MVFSQVSIFYFILPHIANRNLSIQENDGSTPKPAFSRISTCGYKYSHDYSIFQSDASRINKTPPDRLKRKFFKRSHFRRKCKLFPRLLKISSIAFKYSEIVLVFRLSSDEMHYEGRSAKDRSHRT